MKEIQTILNRCNVNLDAVDAHLRKGWYILCGCIIFLGCLMVAVLCGL
jgi:hypothetical protein